MPLFIMDSSNRFIHKIMPKDALKNNNQVVGCVGVEHKSDDLCELRRMSVDTNARKGGLGTKLVRVVEEFAAQNNYKTLYLSTGCIMSPAIGLYHRTGFEDFEENMKMLPALYHGHVFMKVFLNP